MITKITSARNLPYKTYIATLIKNDTEIDEKYKDMDGYLLITKSPKMTILFFEYKDGTYDKVSKEIWNHV